MLQIHFRARCEGQLPEFGGKMHQYLFKYLVSYLKLTVEYQKELCDTFSENSLIPESKF